MSATREHALLSDAVALVQQHGSYAAAARAGGIPVSTLKGRVTKARQIWPTCLPESDNTGDWARESWPIPARVDVDVAGKTFLTGGDLHRWPGPMSKGLVAFLTVAHEIMPDGIVLGGDMIDGARVSRHPRQHRVATPTLLEEVTQLRSDLAQLPKCEHRLWSWGNHDDRGNTYLANQAPELSDFAGSLEDRFPEWSIAWSFRLGSEMEHRHRFKGGIHAAWNNVLHAGISTCTFHTHQQQIKPHIDRSGRRWGIEPGMLADPEGPQFIYGEGAPSRHSMGFAVLTFDHYGVPKPPELCEYADGRMWFRGREVGKARYRVPAKTRAI